MNPAIASMTCRGFWVEFAESRNTSRLPSIMRSKIGKSPLIVAACRPMVQCPSVGPAEGFVAVPLEAFGKLHAAGGNDTTRHHDVHEVRL